MPLDRHPKRLMDTSKIIGTKFIAAFYGGLMGLRRFRLSINEVNNIVDRPKPICNLRLHRGSDAPQALMLWTKSMVHQMERNQQSMVFSFHAKSIVKLVNRRIPIPIFRFCRST